MRVAVLDTIKDKKVSYTKHFLIANAKKYNINITSPQEADVICVSLNDVEGLSKLRAYRRKYNDKQIIVGGMEGYAGEQYLKYADAVWVGESEAFFKMLAEEGKVDYNSPHIVTIENRSAIAAEEIDFTIAPLLHQSKNNYTILAEKGCKRFCTFCLTGWSIKRSTAPETLLRKAYIYVSKRKNASLNLICNDTARFSEFLGGRTGESLTVKNYLKHPERCKAAMLRFGVEGLSEEKRKRYNKPISNDELRELIDVLKQQNQRALFFLIIDEEVDRELEEFREVIGRDTAAGPPIWLKFTYLNPRPQTPLWTKDISNYIRVERDWLAKYFFENRRVRINSFKNVCVEMWRTIFSRTRLEDVHKAEILAKKVTANMDVAELIQLTKSLKLDYTLNPDTDEDYLPNSGIVTRYRGLGNKKAKKLGFERWEI